VTEQTPPAAGSAVPDLDAIEQRANAVRRGPAMSWQRECFDQCQDALALVAHCRALRADNARLRAALEEAKSVLRGYYRSAWDGNNQIDLGGEDGRSLEEIIDAALAAPAAGQEERP